MEAKAPTEIVNRWLLACGCFVLLLFFFSPSWGAFRAWSRAPEMGFLVEVRRGGSVLEQVAHPGAAVADTLHGAIQWRLLFPVIGRVLHLPPPAFFALAHLGCVLALGFIITVLRRRGTAWADAGLVTVILGAGSWYFASMCWLGYFDSWLVLGLLLVAFARSSRSVWLACLWAPWIDERFVVAAPLALLCRILTQPKLATNESPLVAWRKEFAVPSALLAGFVVVRLGVLGGSTAAGATVGGYFDTLKFGDGFGTRILFGIWEGLRAGWFLAGLAVVLQQRGRAVLLVVGLAVMAVGLATAQDFSRSMMFLLPVALLGALAALEAKPRWLPGTLRVAAAAALLLPAHLVMSNHAQPVHGFYHELAALDNPPGLLLPANYELRAIHALEQGQVAQAEADLTIAIKLADNPAGPSKQRGILYASAGRWEDARRDFATAVKHSPEDPETWYLRAQAELALNDAPAARADVQRALSLAPKEWSSRPDVARFLTRLGGAVMK